MFLQDWYFTAPQALLQLAWCYIKFLLLTRKSGRVCAVEMTAESGELIELPIGATTDTQTRHGVWDISQHEVKNTSGCHPLRSTN